MRHTESKDEVKAEKIYKTTLFTIPVATVIFYIYSTEFTPLFMEKVALYIV